ncbi:MAG: TIGR00730 family Rossman fold protein [Patescibacteria group bacterium]
MPKKKLLPSREEPPVEKRPRNGHSFFDVQPSWTGTAPSTSSQRVGQWLCDEPHKKCIPAQDHNFTENINWRIFRIMAEFVEGFEFLSHLRREVTCFGSARVASDDPHYQLAKKLGFLCGKAGYTVITGGGPGIMEAANWGAYESGGESVGLDIALPMEQRRNQYVKKGKGFHYFFTRKVMLSASAQAYVYFPGGFGTLDELFEVIVLIQTRKMSDQVPVILVGKKFWQPLIVWARDTLWREHHFIEQEDVKLFHMVDTAEEAFEIIKKTKERTL